MSLPLLGPDGKELGAAKEVPGPQPRTMPTTQEKFNMALMMFTLMSAKERQILIKQLRPLRRKLDVMYPNGMSEGDIKADMTKAAEAVIEEAGKEPEPMTDEERELENEIESLTDKSVPEQDDNAEPQTPKVGAEQDIPVQPENNVGC